MNIQIEKKISREIPAEETKKSTKLSEIYVWGNDSCGQLGTSDYSF